MSQFKPLLASPVDLETLKFPTLASPKLDGIRCLIIDGVAMSRSLKPIRNEYVQKVLGKPEYNGLDGELIVGDPWATDCYNVTNSGVMSKDGEPDFCFHVFDRWDMPDTPYVDRLAAIKVEDWPFISVPQAVMMSMNDLLHYEDQCLQRGYEGIMIRSGDGKYKYGRSTAKEGILLKLKRFVDAEYKIVGFEERMHNANEATKNALGQTERSTHKENLVGRGDLGALVLETADGLRFNCGTGFTDSSRSEIWSNRDRYLGQFAKIKSFLIGVKDLPRFPVFLGMRDPIDMGG